MICARPRKKSHNPLVWQINHVCRVNNGRSARRDHMWMTGGCLFESNGEEEEGAVGDGRCLIIWWRWCWGQVTDRKRSRIKNLEPRTCKSLQYVWVTWVKPHHKLIKAIRLVQFLSKSCFEPEKRSSKKVLRSYHDLFDKIKKSILSAMTFIL